MPIFFGIRSSKVEGFGCQVCRRMNAFVLVSRLVMHLLVPRARANECIGFCLMARDAPFEVEKLDEEARVAVIQRASESNHLNEQGSIFILPGPRLIAWGFPCVGVAKHTFSPLHQIAHNPRKVRNPPDSQGNSAHNHSSSKKRKIMPFLGAMCAHLEGFVKLLLLHMHPG